MKTLDFSEFLFHEVKKKNARNNDRKSRAFQASNLIRLETLYIYFLILPIRDRYRGGGERSKEGEIANRHVVGNRINKTFFVRCTAPQIRVPWS